MKSRPTPINDAITPVSMSYFYHKPYIHALYVGSMGQLDNQQLLQNIASILSIGRNIINMFLPVDK